MKGGGLCYCTLSPGKTSRAVKHKTVEEISYFLEGQGDGILGSGLASDYF
jgi:uncharacterized cupin superfamily protein